MDLPWSRITLSSLMGSFCLVQFAPHYSISVSYVQTLAVLQFVLTTAAAIWKVILWPKLFSPLRHLPSPSVSWILIHVVHQAKFDGRVAHSLTGSSQESQKIQLECLIESGLIIFLTMV